MNLHRDPTRMSRDPLDLLIQEEERGYLTHEPRTKVMTTEDRRYYDMYVEARRKNPQLNWK